jgi:hypothetical protein
MSMDKQVLSRSHAGLRLIAQMTIYNSRDFTRLRSFLIDSYAPALFEVQSAPLRLSALRKQHAELGKLRVHQVIAADPHHVVAIVQAQNNALRVVDLQVEEAYPHRIIHYEMNELMDEPD